MLPCPHRDRTAGTGGRSSLVVIRCLGDHRAASHPAMAGLWRVGRRAAGLSNRCGDLPLPGRRSAAWRSPRRPLAAGRAWLQPCCATTRPLPFGAWPPGSGTGAQSPRGRGLVRQPVRRGGPGRSTRSGSRPGSPARSGRSAWSLQYRRLRQRARRGLADARLGPNGPPSRDVGPQRPPVPHDKAEDTKQRANGGGDWR